MKIISELKINGILQGNLTIRKIKDGYGEYSLVLNDGKEALGVVLSAESVKKIADWGAENAYMEE